MILGPAGGDHTRGRRRGGVIPHGSAHVNQLKLVKIVSIQHPRAIHPTCHIIHTLATFGTQWTVIFIGSSVNLTVSHVIRTPGAAIGSRWQSCARVYTRIEERVCVYEVRGPRESFVARLNLVGKARD